MTKLEKLKAQRLAIGNQIAQIEAKAEAVEAAAFVGKFFKYPKNCYSMPKKASDYWPVYLHVIGPCKDGCGLCGVSFATDSEGDVYVKSEPYITIGMLRHGGGYVPITEIEYRRAAEAMETRVMQLVA